MSEGVLQSLKEVIISQQGANQHEPTPTEFFAIILSSLCSGKQNTHIVELLEILAAVIPRSATAIVRSQFQSLSVVLMGLCKVNIDNSKVIRLCLTCLARSMQQQETSEAFWKSRESMQALNALLKLIDDPKVRLRKAVQDELVSLLQVHKQQKATFVRAYVAEFCIEIMKACKKAEYKRALHVVIFLEKANQYMISSDSIRICEYCLRLQDCQQAVLSVESFRMLDAFYQSANYSLSANETAQTVQCMLNSKPFTHDMETNVYFCSAIASGICALKKQSNVVNKSLLVQSISILVSKCEMEFTQVHTAVGNAIKRILGACVDETMIADSLSSLHKGKKASVLSNVIVELEQILQLRFQNTWIYVLDCLKSGLFGIVMGKDKTPILSSIIIKLGQLNDALESGMITEINNGTQMALTDTLGAALRSIGLYEFLTLLPLVPASDLNSNNVFNDSKLIIAIDPIRAWLFHTLRLHLKHITNNSIQEFVQIIIEPVRKCNQNRINMTNNLSENQITLSKQSVNQLWSLFPELCVHAPVDIHVVFPKINTMLMAVMRDETYPDVLAHVSIALTNMIKSVVASFPVENIRHYIDHTNMESLPDTSHLKALYSQCNVFLPLYLNILETFDIHDYRFPNIIQCVASLTSIAPGPIITIMSKKLLKLLLSTTASYEASDAATCWMTVILAIIPYVPNAIITLLYRTIRPLLSVDENISLQKRAYRVLEALLKHHSALLFTMELDVDDDGTSMEESRTCDAPIPMQILDLISTSLLTCNVSARHMRLNCISQLFSALSDGDLIIATDKILGEILICQKDANKKSRDSALELLRVIINRFPSEQLFIKLCSAIVAETTTMRSSAVISICLLMMEHSENEVLVQNIVSLYPSLSLLLTENCVEQTRAFLQYTKIMCSIISPSTLKEIYPSIADNIFNNIDRLKTKFASRIRGILRKIIHKFQHEDGGIEYVREHIPLPDQALLDYILKQTRKQEKARKRKRDQKHKDKISSTYEYLMGSDSEDDDIEETVKSEPDDEDAMVVDSRFPSRAKATNANTAITHAHLPSSLDDLINNDSNVLMNAAHTKMSKANARKASEVNEEADEEKYAVDFNADGVLIVKEKKVEVDVVTPVVTAEEEKDVGCSYNKRGTGPAAKKKRVYEAGEEYRAKKGTGGDVWKNGQLEPHAFIPLDSRMLTKKNTSSAVEQYSAVVKNGRNTGGGNRKSSSAKQAAKEERKQARRDKRRALENADILSRHGLNEHGTTKDAQHVHLHNKRKGLGL